MRVCVRASVCACECVHVRVCVCMRVCGHFGVCVCVVYVCMRLCFYMCVNIHVVTFACHYYIRSVTSSLQYAILSSNGLVVKIGWMMTLRKVVEKRCVH